MHTEVWQSIFQYFCLFFFAFLISNEQTVMIIKQKYNNKNTLETVYMCRRGLDVLRLRLFFSFLFYMFCLYLLNTHVILIGADNLCMSMDQEERGWRLLNHIHTIEHVSSLSWSTYTYIKRSKKKKKRESDTCTKRPM